MLRLVGIAFLQDLLSLDPGQRWAQQLYRHIDTSDVLFLFWSTPAKKSKWVTKEWRYGLKQKGLDFIKPVIIEGPPPVAPPRALKKLHFNDWLQYVIRAEEAARVGAAEGHC
jgi:TIR domain